MIATPIKTKYDSPLKEELVNQQEKVYKKILVKIESMTLHVKSDTYLATPIETRFDSPLKRELVD